MQAALIGVMHQAYRSVYHYALKSRKIYWIKIHPRFKRGILP